MAAPRHWHTQVHDYAESIRRMNIRFGVSPGADTAPDQLASIVDHWETNGVDSLWFSEPVYAPSYPGRTPLNGFIDRFVAELADRQN
jgi:hypothetical protein